jgi:hypothetical protein
VAEHQLAVALQVLDFAEAVFESDGRQALVDSQEAVRGRSAPVTSGKPASAFACRRASLSQEGLFGGAGLARGTRAAVLAPDLVHVLLRSI